MGGRPLTALNVVILPSEHLDMSLLKEILHGGHDKVVEAGASLVGGHTVDDEEPKYGLCVNGVVHPERIITNAGSKVGDALILTKPVGTGVLFNAVRSGKMPYKDVERDVLPIVASLNGAAMEVALQFELHACTDITGFGIAGHLLEVAIGSNARANLQHSNLQLYPGVLDMYRAGETTGSNPDNRRMTQDYLEIQVSLSSVEEETLFDPQTSGGLLFSVPDSEADGLISALSAAGVNSAFRVGEIVEGPPGIVVV
jgi:selenide,water dikinase